MSRFSAPEQFDRFVFMPTPQMPKKALFLIFLLHMLQIVGYSPVSSEKQISSASEPESLSVEIKPTLENTLYSHQQFFKPEEKKQSGAMGFVTQENIRVMPELFQYVSTDLKQLIILMKQIDWIKEIFENEMSLYFDKELLKQVFSDGPMINIDEKTNFIKQNFPRFSGEFVGPIGRTTTSGITVSFDPIVNKIEIRKVLVNEMHHWINSKMFARISKEKNENWGYPFVNVHGQIDEKLFESFKLGIDKGEERIKRIPKLLVNDNRLGEEDLALKHKLLALVDQYQPTVFAQTFTAKELTVWKRNYPNFHILETIKHSNLFWVRFLTVSPNEKDSINKLKAIAHDFELTHAIFKESKIELYHVKKSNSLYKYYTEYASNIDMLFQNNALKHLLLKEYCRYMEDYYQSALGIEPQKFAYSYRM